MAYKTCLDTSVCIEIIRDNAAVLSSIGRESDDITFVSSVTVFELLLRETNLNEVEGFIKDCVVLGFDSVAARKASEIEKDLKKRGILIDRPDIFIAATAMVNDCQLATLNVKDFSRIKGLKLVRLR